MISVYLLLDSYLKQLTSNLVCTKTTFKTNLNLKT